jgi:hypothetical protein
MRSAMSTIRRRGTGAAARGGPGRPRTPGIRLEVDRGDASRRFGCRVPPRALVGLTRSAVALVVLAEASSARHATNELLDRPLGHGKGMARSRGATSLAKRRMLDIASSYGTPA